MTDTNELVRANKLTVKVSDIDTAIYTADFFRTHRHIASVNSDNTEWTAPAGATKTAARESFRQYMADHATEVGVMYDPADRRVEQNIRKPVYKTISDLAEDVGAMITPDINTFYSKMPHNNKVQLVSVTVDNVIPKHQTSKGTDLTLMGVDDGKYANGNLAWFDIEATVTMSADNGIEIYQMIPMELVSGQIRKCRMTQTQWNTEVLKSMVEAGILTEDEVNPKKAKEIKEEDKKEQVSMDTQEPTPAPTRKRACKSKKEDKVEG